MATSLLANKHRITVWNRTPERADTLVADGARLAQTLEEAIAANPLTIVCLNDYDTTHKLLAPAGSVLQGRTLINLTSGTPAEVRTATDWADRHGINYLDGAIMVPPAMVGQPDGVFLYAGPSRLFERHRSSLATLGDPRYLGEDVTLAVLYNTALLEMMYATLNGWLHATALVDSADVSAQTFAELALGWFMPKVVGYPSLAALAPQLDAADYPGSTGTMEMNLKALEHILRTSEEQNVSSGFPHSMKDIAQAAVDGGYHDRSYLAVYEVLRNPERAE
ncbi:NAD(P)-binding domain-containing protein [Nocardia sp. NPDC050193]